jgi:hypothetical protein
MLIKNFIPILFAKLPKQKFQKSNVLEFLICFKICLNAKKPCFFNMKSFPEESSLPLRMLLAKLFPGVAGKP